MESLFQKHEKQKTEQFRANDYLVSLLDELKKQLLPIQKAVRSQFISPKWPIGAIIGNPRSGSTVLLQWLASLGVFSYPTNLLARFAYAPYVGAMVQQILFNETFDFHGEFSDIHSELNFESILGKSKGALATNEFAHFFRNYMPNFDIQFLNDNEFSQCDTVGMASGLASIEHVFGKPFVTKANLLQYNLSQFALALPSMLWIYIRREPIYVMQSILLSREKYFNNRSIWWSVRPKEYEWLKEMDIYHQIAGQVFFTEKAIGEGLSKVPESHKLFVDYETFCGDPGSLYTKIIEYYKYRGCELPAEDRTESSFTCNNIVRLPEKDMINLEAAYNYFSKNLKHST